MAVGVDHDDVAIDDLLAFGFYLVLRGESPLSLRRHRRGFLLRPAAVPPPSTFTVDRRGIGLKKNQGNPLT